MAKSAAADAASGRGRLRFQDRVDAGKRLGERLLLEVLPAPVVVLALPRGGVPVAAQVAAALQAPLEVFVACKIGAPRHREFGIGAVAEGSELLVVTDAARLLGIDPAEMRALASITRVGLQRQVDTYRSGRQPPEVSGKTVVLVDDGLATGVTAEAALRALRERDPQRLVLAVPVGPVDACRRLGAVADAVICLVTPPAFAAVGQWYEDFGQTSDEEVLALLGASGTRTGGA